MVFNTAGPWFFPQRGCLKCNQYLDPVRMRSDAEYRHLLELDKADAMRNAPPIHQVIRECRERVMVALSDTPSPAIGDRASGLKACAYLANMDVLDHMRREARK
jgi:hypothetical protein